MATWKAFEDIEAWQDARSLCKSVYSIFQHQGAKNDFALRDQMVRSSGSIMDNIAEGFERNGRKEFIQFLSIAKASCGEVRSQLYRCLDREYIDQSEFEQLMQKSLEAGKKIGGLIRYLKTSEYKGSKFSESEYE